MLFKLIGFGAEESENLKQDTNLLDLGTLDLNVEVEASTT